MQNVAPSHALVRRSRQLLLFAFLTVAIGTFLAVIGIALRILPLANLQQRPTIEGLANLVFILGVIVGIVGLVMAARAATWRTDNDLALTTGKFLGQFLDERYTFIRNISKIGLGYIDAVLVGPPGVLVFRILDDEGVFFNETSKWLRQARDGQWAPMRTNPTEQAVEDIKHLREYFGKRGLPNMPVFGIIVFTKDPNLVQISAERPTVPPAQLQGTLEAVNDNYMAKERIDAATTAAVVRTLYTPA